MQPENHHYPGNCLPQSPVIGVRMRTFLSYDIEDQPLIEKIKGLQRDLLRSSGADLKLVAPNTLHFTIRFLGEIEEVDKENIVRKLSGNVGGYGQEVLFRGLGTFPDTRRISVVWIGIDEASAKKLAEHAALVNRLLDSVPGIPKSDREVFSPHVTIARVKSGRNKERLVEAVRAHRDDELGSAKITNLRLKLSTLTPSGPEYTDLHIFET